MPVPWRGWSNIPVRVCDQCFAREQKQEFHLSTSTSLKEFEPSMKSNPNPNNQQKGHGKMPNQKETEKGDKAMRGDIVKVKQAQSAHTEAKPSETSGVTARYVGEVVQSAVGLATGMLQYSKEIVVESARPAYWEADADITHCRKCKVKFDPRDYQHCTKHHCRACGKGFCDGCSSYNEIVPDRGWDYPVRVCETCVKILRQRI